MSPVIHIIDERLANAGDTLPFVGHLAEASYRLGEHSFSLPEGIDFDLVLTNAGEGILASGMLNARVTGICDRCLEPAHFDVAGEVDEYFLFKRPEGAAELGNQDCDPDDDYSLVSPDNTIDLSEALHTALLMETPYVVLCRDDCRGLCAVCGANLNVADCGHNADLALRREQERLDASPFASLRNLRLNE